MGHNSAGKRAQAGDPRRFTRIGVVGAGVMGQGIAQLAAVNGLQVKLIDAKAEVMETAINVVEQRFKRLVEKNRMTEAEAELCLKRIVKAPNLAALSDCDIVIEAVVEDVEVKRALFSDLEKQVPANVTFATNTSSLPVASIARTLTDPGRLAGMHFFNPVPLMQLVEVIAAPATREETIEQITDLAAQLERTAVRVKDSPGFLVNLGGRAYYTEALAILSESVATSMDIDATMRDCWGFRMGPFELMDLTGIDVNYPVTDGIYQAFSHDPRLRTRPCHALLLEAGRLGRKTGHGFYRYPEDPGGAPAPEIEIGVPPKAVSVLNANPLLEALCREAGVGVLDRDDGESPILAAPIGLDCSTLAVENGLDHRRLVAIDTLGQIDKRLTIMSAPGASSDIVAAVAGLCKAAGTAPTVIADSPGFIGQRIVAMIVNLGCEIAQLGLATPGDIDTAMRLGLNYPKGPLALGDDIGLPRVRDILERLHSITGDDRYRPSLWLRRRAQLGLSASQSS